MLVSNRLGKYRARAKTLYEDPVVMECDSCNKKYLTRVGDAFISEDPYEWLVESFLRQELYFNCDDCLNTTSIKASSNNQLVDRYIGGRECVDEHTIEETDVDRLRISRNAVNRLINK